LHFLHGYNRECDHDDEEEQALHGGERSESGYLVTRRCPGIWWTPPPSKRLGRAILVRRVRFPSTSANSLFVRQPPDRLVDVDRIDTQRSCNINVLRSIVHVETS